MYDDIGFVIDSLSYQSVSGQEDSLFTIALVHPDSCRFNMEHWNLDKPTPLSKSTAYLNFLFEQEQKAIWKKRLYIGGGSFFFICLLGIVWFRYSKKR